MNSMQTRLAMPGRFPSDFQTPSAPALPRSGSPAVQRNMATIAQSQSSAGRTVLEEERSTTIDGLNGDGRGYDSLSSSQPQSSLLLNINDPIQVHLLVETALGDSRDFDLLSQEEVDRLKRECQTLQQRIEQTRQNLAMQSKYRDAAISMAKLYTPAYKGSDPKRSRRSLLGLRASNGDQVELADQERLSSERKCEELATGLFNLEKRLIDPQRRLLEHTAGILQMTHKGPVKINKSRATDAGGVPGSPESMYTYTNGRGSIEPIGEGDLFDERSFYRAFDGTDALGISRYSFDGKSHLKTVQSAEQKLVDVTNELSRLIAKVSPNAALGPPPVLQSSDDANAGKALLPQLDFVATGITTVGEGLQRTNAASRGEVDQMKTVLIGLWDIIQSGEDDVRQRKLQRQQMKAKSGLLDDSDESADEGMSAEIEPYSIQAFSTKVQQLFGSAVSLKDHKKVLQRQIKQQRDLNGKADESKSRLAGDLTQAEAALEAAEREVADLQAQLESVRKESDERRQESTQHRDELTRTHEDSIRDLQADLNERHGHVEKLEGEVDNLRIQSRGHADTVTKLTEAEAGIEQLRTRLASSATAERATEERSRKLAEDLQAREAEMEIMNMEIARLQTEVTIARAELDGAYGSRAQRAAEVAANPAVQERVAQLQKELVDTLEDYEQMTKASIEWEKEREDLEREIDKLRDEREALETQLSEEHVLGLGTNSQGAGGDHAPNSTSTTVLKNEFKKMMRDTRAENAKALRAEQAERRRLEDELRTLKKQQGPGRSGLGQHAGA